MGISWPVGGKRAGERKRESGCRFPGAVGSREGLLSGATYRRAHSATVHPFVRKHSCTVIYRLNFRRSVLDPGYWGSISHGFTLLSVLLRIMITYFDYRCRCEATSIDLRCHLTFSIAAIESNEINWGLRFVHSSLKRSAQSVYGDRSARFVRKTFEESIQVRLELIVLRTAARRIISL